jgi:hypothetical protein
MKRAGHLISVMVFLAAFSGRLDAAGLKVGPAGFIIHNVCPGKTYDVYKETGLRLTIYNDDDTSHTYLLSAQRPAGKWEKGYLGIPDPEWCRFNKSEVTVDAHGKGYGNIEIKIPDEGKYYNQHWIVTFGVAGKPGPGGIALAVQIRAQIETKSRAEAGEEKPAGIIAFKPSILRFENTPAGSVQKGSVTIYNNDSKAHTYKITSLLHQEGIKPSAYLTHSYEAIPDPKWIVLEKDTLEIKARDSFILSVQLKVPDQPEYRNRKWEELLLVEPEEGLAGFIRVQI